MYEGVISSLWDLVHGKLHLDMHTTTTAYHILVLHLQEKDTSSLILIYLIYMSLLPIWHSGNLHSRTLHYRWVNSIVI